MPFRPAFWRHVKLWSFFPPVSVCDCNQLMCEVVWDCDLSRQEKTKPCRFDMATYADTCTDVTLVVGGTLLLTLILEFTSREAVRGVVKREGGPRLYRLAWAYSVGNQCMLGVPLYTVAARWLCKPDAQHETSFEWWCAFFGIVFCQSIIYYALHARFHTPALFWIHRFHHQFTSHVPPSAANAVSVVEYVVGYIGPLAVALITLRPSRSALREATAFLQVMNVLVHTPWLEPITERGAPWWLVGAHVHGAHHRRLTRHFASPTINWDAIVECWR